MAYTALFSDATTDVKLAELTDEDPALVAFWLFLLAAGAPWGRLPGNPKLLKARVCPLVERWVSEDIERLTEGLVSAGMITRYTCPWTGTSCIAITNYGRYNDAGRKFHKLGKPEFGPPPGWMPSTELDKYLARVERGDFKRSGKSIDTELEKFGIPLEHKRTFPRDQSLGTSPKGPLPGTTPEHDSAASGKPKECDDPIAARIQSARELVTSRESP